ncbi:MAG: hypothetical protein KBA60_10540 [Flavobacteriales bacterium]|nr:hypothetical protein [Flavobacteriales bacterium]
MAEQKFPVERMRHVFGMSTGMARLNIIFQRVLNILRIAPAKKVVSRSKQITHGTRQDNLNSWLKSHLTLENGHPVRERVKAQRERSCGAENSADVFDRFTNAQLKLEATMHH